MKIRASPQNRCECTRYFSTVTRPQSPTTSRRKGISPLHGKAGFADLRRIGGGNAGELSADIVDDVEVAVRAVVPAETEVGADGLRVGSVHLDEAGEGEEAVEGIVSLEAGEDDGEIGVGKRKAESVPGLRSGYGEFLVGAVVGAEAEF